MSRVRPIFILSLPRSGSTLLQRLIATHPAVATTSEPWLLLPLFLGFREGHVFATYQQRYLSAAFEDFMGELDGAGECHASAVRRFAGTFYQHACAGGQTHFLDKTPRYHLIADDLLETFPDASFILLWRNPLAVAASCIETWGRGRFALHDQRLDLYEGLSKLIEVSKAHRERLLVLRYEDLVTEPEPLIARVFEHCGLSPFDGAPDRLREVRLQGRMGDKKGARSDVVSSASLDTWPSAFASPPRRYWARRYLRRLGAEDLEGMGYEMNELLSRLEAQPRAMKSIVSDLFWMTFGCLAVATQSAFRSRRRTLIREGRTPRVALE